MRFSGSADTWPASDTAVSGVPSRVLMPALSVKTIRHQNVLGSIPLPHILHNAEKAALSAASFGGWERGPESLQRSPVLAVAGPTRFGRGAKVGEFRREDRRSKVATPK